MNAWSDFYAGTNCTVQGNDLDPRHSESADAGTGVGYVNSAASSAAIGSSLSPNFNECVR
jgi:hypothetical protein